VQVLTTLGRARLSDGRFQCSLVPNPVGSTKFADLVGMQAQHLVERQEDWIVLHFASFRNVPACRRSARVCTFASRAPRERPPSSGVMIRRFPSVLRSRSVSCVIPSKSRIGRSMMIPALFPIACNRFVMPQV